FVGWGTGRSAGFAPRRDLSRPGGPVAPAHACATPSYQILKRGSPVLEIASALQAFALALSAIRSARNGALSLRPPALMYCCASLPRDRQFSESSYFIRRSRTSTTHRLAASLN